MLRPLKDFKEHNVNLVHIESRSSERVPGYEFLVELDSTVGTLKDFEGCQDQSSYSKVITRNILDNPEAVPWFPREIQDLDRFANQILLLHIRIRAGL